MADPALVTDLFARIVAESPLLPPSLAGDSRELLAIRVSTADGRDVYASSSAWSQYTSETALESQLGALRIRTALSGRLRNA